MFISKRRTVSAFFYTIFFFLEHKQSKGKILAPPFIKHDDDISKRSLLFSNVTNKKNVQKENVGKKDVDNCGGGETPTIYIRFFLSIAFYQNI